ncbi:MAG: DUF2652 domain-containing protein [Candidatus Promineifilaceae bacterium]|nr:DUF2652 domain-containing protein [Candidatus Promineifilaceae bacterium]
MTKAQEGYFLIADITGYTVYLHESELEHAQETLQALLELLINHTKPPLVISRLAGDAVISYALKDNFFGGQTFVEMIEDTYVAFRKAINLMVLNNTCHCKACANVSALDLKFFVHYGSFAIQHLSEHDELVGNDVNLIHRLLKNHVTERTGYRAYTLYTDAAIRQLGIKEISLSMTRHVEIYEHLGDVHTWVQEMHAVWEAKKDESQIVIADDDVMAFQEKEFSLSPVAMWDIVTNPEYRAIFVRSTRQNILNRQDGRLAAGSIYQCFHGDKRITLQVILDWRPFEQMTTEDTTPIPGAKCLINIKLIPMETGTRLQFTSSKARGPWLSRVICNLLGPRAIRRMFREGLRELKERLDQEMAAGQYEPVERQSMAPEEIEQAAASSLNEVSDVE